MKRFLIVAGASCLVGVVALAGSGSGAAVAAQLRHSTRSVVAVPPGQPLQIVTAVDDGGFFAPFAPSVREAVQMAIEQRPKIHGFRIQLNAFDAPCGNGSTAALAANAAVASAVVANVQNVAVIGHTCSAEASSWLPPYQTAGLVTINGSVTGSAVPALGPAVFNATSIADPGFSAWYSAVVALPSDIGWRARFQARFGAPPSDFADLYYDATNVLLRAIRRSSRIDHHNLVIDRAALAANVRATRAFRGVTCNVSFDPATGFRINDPAALARCARHSHKD
jgi:ABC-type branched-subunit amino acid transport system substrate-binding protein